MCHPVPPSKTINSRVEYAPRPSVDRAPDRDSGARGMRPLSRLPRCRQTLLCARTFRHRPEEVLLTNT
jgi:hypothetical protein